MISLLRLVQEFCSSQVSSEDDSDRSEEALYDGLDEELVTWDSFWMNFYILHAGLVFCFSCSSSSIKNRDYSKTVSDY